MNLHQDDGSRLLRYLDNELSGKELEEFRAHLLGCPECRDRLAEEESLSRLLRRSRPLYSAPAELRARVLALVEQQPIRRAPEPPPNRAVQVWKRATRAASRFLQWKWFVPVAGLLTVYFVLVSDHRANAATYVATAAANHRGYLRGELPAGIRSESPEQVAAWFGRKLPFQFRLPASPPVSPANPAYRLIGASQVACQGSQAALLIYRAERETVTLMIASTRFAPVAGGEQIRSGRLTFHYHTNSNLRVTTWSTHGLSYALVSPLSASSRDACLVCHQNMADHARFEPRASR